MPEISLTDFVDFVIKSGTPKLTKVREIKKRGDYEPAFDFWKQLREGIQIFHKNGLAKRNELDNAVGMVNDPKKMRRYIQALTGYKRFLGRKEITWFDPPSEEWLHEDLIVRLNPELGLNIEGKRFVIKLYFKNESPTKHRLDVVLAMLSMVLGPKAQAGTTMAVLDVSKGKLITPTRTVPDLMVLVRGEAASFLQIWNAIT
jgi:hypothetical protein